MAATALPLPISQTSSKTLTYRKRSMKFGNGHQEDADDGINVKVEKWNIVYDNIDTTTYNSIETFLDTVRGVSLVSFTPPGASSPKYYKIDGDISIAALAGGVWNVSFPMIQVYELP